MVTRIDKYLGGLGIDATGKLEVTDNAAVVIGNGSTTGNVYAGTINSGGVELRSNDYATLLSAYSNDYSTLNSAYSNDGATLSSARANDFNTYSVVLGGLTGANTAITNLQTGLSGANTNLSGNVAIFTGALTGSNVRLAGAESNVIALQGGLAGSNTRIVGAESNVIALQGGLSSSNSALSDNVTIFTGAFTGSNTRLSGAEANVASLQSGISGSNTTILNLSGGLTGSNTRITGAESNVIALQGGLSGANTAISARDTVANVYTTWNYLNSNIILKANTASPTFTGTVTTPNLTLTAAGGIEGGQLDFANAVTNTTIATGIAIDIYGDKIRFFEKGGTNRGAYIDLSVSGTAVGSNLLAGTSSNVYALEGGLAGTNTAILNLQSGLSGSNTRISGAESNVIALQGGLSGSNTRLSEAEANVIALRGGLAGANTVDVNQTTGLVGANTNITNLTTGLTGTNTNLSGNVAIFNGAFTGSNTRLSGAESNVTSLQGGLSGTNTNIAAITSSPVTFQSNVTILGNLNLTGNSTIITANTISFGDSLLSLASNSTADVLDIGLYGHYSGGGYSNNHTGIIRSVASQDWMFFAAYAKEEPNLTVDIANSTFALANIRVRTANASLNVYAANALISPLVYSGAVELRSNDYATYLMALGGISAANTAIALRALAASPTFTGNATFDTNTLFVDSVNDRVGIGNTTPAYKLHVQGDAYIRNTTESRLFIQESATAGLLKLAHDTSVGIVGTTGSYPLQFIIGNGEVARFDTSGNFGINAASPAFKLDVRGTANTGALTSTTVSSGGVELRANDYATYLMALGGLTGANTNITALTGGLAGANTAIALRALADSPTFTGNATFDTTTLFVDSLNDRVGIGTTSPTAKFHVAGTGTAARIIVESTGTTGSNLPSLYFSRTSNVSAAADFQGALVWSRTLTDSTSITSSIQSLGTNISGSQAMNLTYNAYTSHQFQINATEAVRIDSSGNVGIGTSSPGTQLNVYKSTATQVAIRPQNSLAYADFGPISDGTVYGPYAAPAASTGLIVGTSNLNPVQLWTNGAERMRIDASGNVGIGTASAAYKLDVRGTANVGALTTSGTVTLGSNTNVKITGGSANQVLATDGSGNLSYVTVQGVPVASIIMYGANTAPSGWLVCDGTAVSRSTYAALFAVVSNVFGIGDNTTTFNLPDFRGRSPYGVDASQSITIGASSAGKINVNFQTATGTGTSGSTADTNTVTTSTTNSTTDKDVTNSITVVTGVTPIAHTHTVPALTVTHPAEVVQFIIKT